ncbi:MAG TPA: hypothetical protein VJ840_18700 [Gemmatimonadaceae bacterium]|nr:hypothetical protein [Gemmatimonadaceae bacterium]
MKLKAVVCRVDDGPGTPDQLINLDPHSFIELLDQATQEDDLAALEAEMYGKAAPATPSLHIEPKETQTTAVPAGMMVAADGKSILLPREAIEPLMQAKTRGELIEKFNELMQPFGIQVAGA